MKHIVICNNCNHRIINVETLIRQALELENLELDSEKTEGNCGEDMTWLQKLKHLFNVNILEG